ncbi:unnamed protein product [Caenorhabditis bovis]|uniref:DUF19 domain-containing protein n=1 Tax=Caenorhabditis bovis TaxID=2654633 RepID=A0A8S1F9I0_9PELO|nr:unnamed protein product [Caenorhabditis bovis]
MNDTMQRFVVIFAVISPLSAFESICQNYLEVERQFNCGEDGYPLNYGYKNCLIFTSNQTRQLFSEEGRTFVECCSKCLITAIRNISKTADNCNQIHEQSFKSHVDCYLSCDFCKVCKTQKMALLHSYDWTDFASVLAVQQIASIVRECGIFNCFL